MFGQVKADPELLPDYLCRTLEGALIEVDLEPGPQVQKICKFAYNISKF